MERSYFRRLPFTFLGVLLGYFLAGRSWWLIALVLAPLFVAAIIEHRRRRAAVVG
jgi:small-conductance mechanosensitive channel